VVTVSVSPGTVEVTVSPGAVEVIVLVVASVTVFVVSSPAQAAKIIPEPMAAPPTTKPASFKNSRLDISPEFLFFGIFFFSNFNSFTKILTKISLGFYIN
jgi:hypothetical protein